MTKKDYELIARVLKGRLENGQHLDKFGYSQKEINMAITVVRDTIDFLAHDLKRDNERFDIARFRTACGL